MITFILVAKTGVIDFYIIIMWSMNNYTKYIKVNFMTQNKKDPVNKPQRQSKKNAQLAPRYEIVNLLKTARKAQDITQEDLARRIGTKKSNISRFESGRYNPSLDFLIKVSNSLGLQLQITVKGSD